MCVCMRRGLYKRPTQKRTPPHKKKEPLNSNSLNCY